MYSILIVNSDDQDTYGTVWYFDLANDGGAFPLLNPVDKKTMDFLDWLEYYADRTLELEDRDLFFFLFSCLFIFYLSQTRFQNGYI